MTTKKELYNALISSVYLKGFDTELKEDGILWKKIIEGKCFSVFIGYSGYPGRYFLQPPFASISFNIVEDKMINLSIPSKFIYNKFTCRILYDQKLNDLGLSDISISSTADFIISMQILNKFLIEVNEFFNSMYSLNNVLQKLNSLEMKDAINFLGQPLPLRKLVLLYLTDKEEYIAYSNKVKTSLSQSESPLLKSYDELISRLESSQV